MTNETTLTFSDKLMLLAVGLDVFVLLLHKYGGLPTPIEWVGIGMVWGLILVAFIDALRRSLKLW